MHTSRFSGTTILAAIAVALISFQAVAADAEITSVATNYALTAETEGAGGFTASYVTISSAPSVFTVRLGFNLYHEGLADEHPDDSANADYTTTFSVLSSGNYDMTVTIYRAGELRREHLDPFVVSCGVDLAPMAAPLLTLNSVQPGTELADITLPGASIPLGSDDTAVELAEGSRSQTISFRNRPTRDDVSLLIKMAAHTTVNTSGCEISARLGSPAGTFGIFCPTCRYPGTGDRDINQDGLFVTVIVQDLCGNGDPNSGEACDDGVLNGTLSSCCTTTCQLRAHDEVCRPAVGVCDENDVCTGDSPVCPAADTKKLASEQCRPAATDGCDVAEFCTGVDNNCPADLRRGDGVLCRRADPDALGCDAAEVCDGGVCQPDAKVAANTPCQADANVCTAERCDGNGQCAHIPVAPAGKICDDALFCNGEDRCNAAGLCAVHLNAPCTAGQSCNEFGDACLERPPLVVTNDDGGGAEGSLGNVMGAANLRDGADSIAFDPEFFSVPRRITLTSALPDILGNLKILGPGATLLTIDGANLARVFNVGSGRTAELNGLTITGGNAGAGAGGGILNSGTLTIKGCHVTANAAAFAGGISNAIGGSLSVDRSTISNNTATGNSTGGGITSTNDVTITNSTISGNRATGSGGDNGGGLRLGSATIENSTITKNFAVGPSRAGGLRISVGTVTLRNSIIADNTASTPDISSSSGSLSSGGFNLIGNSGPIAVNGTNDQKGTPAEPLDPLLLPLSDNGGGTPTHAPRATSPALDTGSRFGAIADQRGVMRPFNVASIAGPGDQSDIGAVELQAAIVINADDSGTGSLRQVIVAAPPNGDILFDPAFFGVPRTIALEGEVNITTNLTVNGPGANLLTLSGRNENRVFRILASDLHVAIGGVKLTSGHSPDSGGAILSNSDLALSRCAIVGSHAAEYGGGVYVGNSVATFTDCTFSGNTSGFRGGAVELASSASFTNCTLSGNRAVFGGGGFSLFGTVAGRTVTVADSTIVANTATEGGGVRLEAAEGLSATMTVRSTIFAGNTGGNVFTAAVGGPTSIISRGFNLSSDDGGGYLSDDTDQTGTDAKLGPLQYNGGPTQTHMPLPGSPAIDQGNSAGIFTDQRGRTRSFDAAGVPAIPGSDNSDIGAVEAHPEIVTNNDNTGSGSLRTVVGGALPDADIWFDPVFFAQPRIIFLLSEVLVGESLTIHGPAARLTVSGSALGRVFNIASGIAVAINNLDLLDGKSTQNGGAIASNADLTLTRCTIANGETTARGGGVFLHDAVGWFIDSTISGNDAGGRGGGISLDDASATLVNCTVSSNSAPTFGGGAIGATANAGETIAVTNSTITANSSNLAGTGGVYLEGPIDMTVRSSIVANNTGGSLSGGTITSLGYNLLGNAGAVLGPQDGITNDVQLGPLQANGGPTLTHAPLPGSPAIDKGVSFGLSTDQRGFPRPIDDPAIQNAIGGDGADIGAVEAVPPPAPTATSTATVTRTATAAIATPTRTATQPTGVATATATGTRTATSAVIATATQTRTGTQPTAVATATATRTGSTAVGTQTATATVTRTGSPPAGTPTGSPALGTPTQSPTLTATPPTGICAGDCNGDGRVVINELVLAVNIALDRRPVADCPAADRSGNGTVTIEELITAVRNALSTCSG